MNCGAYMAEIFRAGIQSVDRGQMEAGRSLGLSYGAAMWLVVIPQAIRTMIPSIINQFIITLKDTSILSVIGFPELTNVGKTIMGNTFKNLQTWAIIAVLYMVVIITLSKVSKKFERRINRGR
jgi:polar amino acid transport system permease protein/polar amino acid transport system substrate-binding protein